MATNNAINLNKATFNAYLSAAQSDVTGDATNFLLPCNNTLINEGSYYNTGTYTYAVPTTGNYLLSATVEFLDINNTHYSAAIFLYLGGVLDSTFTFLNAYNLASAGTSLIISANLLKYFTVGDQLTFYVRVSGGNKVIDIGTGTYIMGTLVL